MRFPMQSGIFAAIGAFLLVATAMADVRDAGAKLRGEFGGARRSGRMYRAPVIVRSRPVREDVAQTPDRRRAFSYDPAAPAADSSRSDCGSSAVKGKSTAKAPSVSRSYSYEPESPRSYSYEPRSFQGMRNRANLPTWSLPRSDTRKHGS